MYVPWPTKLGLCQSDKLLRSSSGPIRFIVTMLATLQVRYINMVPARRHAQMLSWSRERAHTRYGLTVHSPGFFFFDLTSQNA